MNSQVLLTSNSYGSKVPLEVFRFLLARVEGRSVKGSQFELMEMSGDTWPASVVSAQVAFVCATVARLVVIRPKSHDTELCSTSNPIYRFWRFICRD